MVLTAACAAPDTVLRMLSQLTACDTVYKSNSGKEYRFNTAIYERLLRIDTLKRFGIEARTRMIAFINRLIAVPAKWVRTGLQNVLNLYTGNTAYIDLFAEYG